jgi:protein-disulfide isomerase
MCALVKLTGYREALMIRQVVLLSLVIGVAGGLLGGWGYSSLVPPKLPSEEPIASSGPSNGSSSIDDASFGDAVERYLLAHPDVLDRVSVALASQKEEARRTRDREAIDRIAADIFSSPDDPVLGNPEGDVTLVELFDYNCTYCRSSMPEIAALLAQDKQLRLVLKEFPILSPGSVQAARVGVLVAKEDVDYWAFHEALFSGRGQVDGEAALKAAQALGLDASSLRTSLESADVTKVLDGNYEVADALKVTGTPTFIIGDEIISGAVGYEALRARIESMRKCGRTSCD